jgi:uncharacterized protein (TIGR02453 family)
VAADLEPVAGAPLSAKIYRIHRDVRFSKDKSPYNAHLHIGFHGGSSGFYFGLEPEGLRLGAGAFAFPGRSLDLFRAAVSREPEGAALDELSGALRQAGFRLDEPALKRVPAPYPAEHPRGDLLRRKGLTAWRDVSRRDVIESPRLLDETLAAFRTLAPLHRWIGAAVGEG